jgi:membrane protein DedA with SNARE-associated domain
MIHGLLEHLSLWIESVIRTLGLPGVVMLMAIESACIPLPSEVIMPFAGVALATTYGSTQVGLLLVALAGAIGCNVGSVLAYEVGAAGGRKAVERYGRYVLLGHEDLDAAERRFARYGTIIVLIARMLPVVRTFIALPAGIARMPRARFHLYTFIGSLPWCWLLAFAGVKLGEHWESLKPYFHRADAVLVVLFVIGVIWFVRGRLKSRRMAAATPAARS